MMLGVWIGIAIYVLSAIGLAAIMCKALKPCEREKYDWEFLIAIPFLNTYLCLLGILDMIKDYNRRGV